MSFKENRPVAWAVLAAVVIGCTLLNGGTGLARERQSANTFYSAGESISADLREASDNAYVMLGIAQRYSDQFSEELLTATQEAIDGLRDALSEGEISWMYEAACTLTDRVEDLYTAGGSLDMQGNDGEDFRYKYKNFTSANLRISHDPYNDSAAEFNRLLSGFPAGLIGSVCGIDALQPFDSAQAR